MKKFFTIGLIIAYSAFANAKSLICDYSSFSKKTGEEQKQQHKMEILADGGGATEPLKIGAFGKMSGSAWSLAGAVVIIAEQGKTRISSTDEGKANLRLETQDAVYEAFCRLE